MPFQRPRLAARSNTALYALALACALAAPAQAGQRYAAPIVYKGDAQPAAGMVRLAQASATVPADKATARINFKYPEPGSAAIAASASTPPAAVPSNDVARSQAPQLILSPNRSVVETATLKSMPAPKPAPAATEAGVGGQGRHYARPASTPTPLAPPAANAEYSETGLAIVYGEEFAGLPTANGEVFDQRELTAAHPSLPLPSLVHVTNLGTGREIVVRVNDRGPFEDNAKLQLSRQAANALGFNGAGQGNVKLRYLGPAPLLSPGDAAAVVPPKVSPASETTLTMAAPRKDVVWPVAAEDDELLGGGSVPAAAPARLMSLKPTGPQIIAPSDTAPFTSAPSSSHFVQLASFSELGNAEAMLRKVEGTLPVEIVPARVNGTDFFRVRVGPFSSWESADQVRARLLSNGTADGRIVTGS